MPDRSKTNVPRAQQDSETLYDDSSVGESFSSSGNSDNLDSDAGNGGGGDAAGDEAQSDLVVLVPGGYQFPFRVRTLPLARWSAGSYDHLREVPRVSIYFVLLECALQLAVLPFQIWTLSLSLMWPEALPAVDRALCRGLDFVESLCPSIIRLPGQIPVRCAATLVDCVCFIPRVFTALIMASFIKLLDW